MSRLEVLLARAAAEKLKAAQPKPEKAKTLRVAKPRVVKPKPQPAPESGPTKFEPQSSLLECIETFTPEQAADPKIVAGTITLFVIEQIMRTDRKTEIMSDNMSEQLAWLTAAAFANKIDLKRVFSTAMMLTDAIEFRGGLFCDEGELVRRLHQIETALLKQKMKRESAR